MQDCSNKLLQKSVLCDCISVCFDICTVNIRVSIRVRRLHLVLNANSLSIPCSLLESISRYMFSSVAPLKSSLISQFIAPSISTLFYIRFPFWFRIDFQIKIAIQAYFQLATFSRTSSCGGVSILPKSKAPGGKSDIECFLCVF